MEAKYYPDSDASTNADSNNSGAADATDDFNHVLAKQEFQVGTKRGFIWQEPIQLMLRNYISTYTPYESVLLYHQLGSGKCMAKDTGILMYDGTIKKIQDVKVGELLMGDDSTPRKVITLARGRDHMYQIIPKSSTTSCKHYTVNKEHILCLQAPTLPKFTHNRHPNSRNFRITWIQDDAFRTRTFSYKRTAKSAVLKQAQAFFRKVKRLHQDILEISVIDYLKLPRSHQAALKGYKVPVEFQHKDMDVDPYSLSLNLNLEHQTHIPHLYKCNSRKTRLALLAGLLDKKDSTEAIDARMYIPSKNESLVADIVFLSESLGFCVEKVKTFNKSTTVLALSGPLYEIPTKRYLLPQKPDPSFSLLYNFDVKYVGEDDYYGFVLDNNCRYLLTDFTVTHNTCTSITIAEGFKEYVRNMGKKIVVLVKNKNIQRNFYNELLSSCTGDEYLDDQQKQMYHSNSTDITVSNFQTRVHRQVNKTYRFITYGTFVNKVLGAKVYEKDDMGQTTTKTMRNEDNSIKRKVPQDAIRDFNNTVIIVDEAHNTTNNDVYTALLKVLSNSYNYRLVLLTATPIFDNVKEIFEISNLLNANNPDAIFPIRTDLLKPENQLVVKEPLANNVLKGNVLRVSDSGLQKLSKTLAGKVSYLQSNKDTYPSKIEMGQDMIKDRLGVTKVVFCPMSKHQFTFYNEAVKTDMTEFGQYDATTTGNVEAEEAIRETAGVSKTSSLYKNSSDASTIVYPDGSYGKDGFIKYQKEFKTILSASGEKGYPLRNLSCKLLKLLRNLEQCKGTAFVYSNYVSFGGTALIRELLLANGFGEYNTSTSIPNRNFVIFTEDSRESYRRIFNSPENKNGKNIKVIIGSPLISEGITLKNVRQVHILEPSWNMSRINQIIGRAIRNHSHDDLDPQDRTVEIYKYVSVYTQEGAKKHFFIDWQKYILSEDKDRANKRVERMLKEISFDCDLLKDRNTITDPQKDHSPECDYTSCNYGCRVHRPNAPLDKSTYQLYIDFFDKYDIDYATSMIRQLFKNYFVWSIDEIINTITKREPMISKEAIYTALGHMTDNKSAVTDMYGRDGFIYRKGGLYIFNDYNIDIHSSFWSKVLDFNTKLNKFTLPQFTQNTFGQSPLLDASTTKVKGKAKGKTKASAQSFETVSLPPDDLTQKEPSQEEKEKQEYNAALLRQYDVVGSNRNRAGEIDGTFRIIDLRSASSSNTSTANSNDKRKNITGMSAVSFSKGALVEIAKHVGIPMPTYELQMYDRPKLSEIIQKFMTDNNRMLH